jgi:hypothetical protein
LLGEFKLRNCEKCSLPPDLCACESEAEEKERSDRLFDSLKKSCPIEDREQCVICGKMCYGLMDFASHVAQIHGISALQYWNKYGHHGEKQINETINPSKRNQDLSWREEE